MDIDVIIPVYNDPTGLSTTLDSLLDQTHSNFHVIIADNGSSDQTLSIAENYQSEHDHISVVVEASIQGSYAARNKGIEAADGEILCFLDADMWVEQDYIDKVSQLMEDDHRYVGCNVELVGDGGVIDRYNEHRGFPVQRDIETFHFAPTCCLIIRQALIDEIGDFDDRLISGGDKEFGNRAYRHGIDLHFEPTITVYHPTRSSLRGFLSKHVRIGRGMQQLQRYHAEHFDRRSLFNPRLYLPENPVSFYRKRRNGITLRRDIFLWYWLETMKKYARTTGRVLEATNPT